MKTKFLLKISLVLLLSIFALLGIDFVLLQGGFSVQKVGVIPARARLAAPREEKIASNQNIRIKNFTVSPTAADGIFRKNSQIKISCSFENISSVSAGNFRSLIRTPKGEIANIKTKTLRSKESMTMEGAITPETEGVLIIACRSDVQDNLEETNENDNHEVKTVYVSN